MSRRKIKKQLATKILLLLTLTMLISVSKEIKQCKKDSNQRMTTMGKIRSFAQSNSKWWNSSKKKTESKKNVQGGWTSFKMAQNTDKTKNKFEGFSNDNKSGKITGYRDEQPARTTRNLYESKTGLLKKQKNHYAAGMVTNSPQTSRTHKWENPEFKKTNTSPLKNPVNNGEKGWKITSKTEKGWNAFNKQTKTKDVQKIKENLSPKKKKKFKVFKKERVYKDGDNIIKEEIMMDSPEEDPNFTQKDFDALIADMDAKKNLKKSGRASKVDKSGTPFRSWKGYLPGNGNVKPEIKSKKVNREPEGKNAKKCVQKAKIILQAQKLNCIDSKASSNEINDCLEKGKGIAKGWSKKCGVKVDYQYEKVKKIDFDKKIKNLGQKSPEVKHEVKEDIRCLRNAHQALNDFIQICWNKNYKLGETGKKMCSLAVEKQVKDWEEKCKHKIQFKAIYERTKTTKEGYSKEECLIQGNKEVLKVIKECWRDNEGLPKLIKACLETKGKLKAEEWSKHCGENIKYDPEMPKIEPEDKGHKNCINRAEKSLNSYIQECHELNRGRSWKVKECLEKGNDLAMKWTKECAVLSIKYKPDIPKIPLENTKECENEAYNILRLYIAGCWRKYKGNNLAIDSCLKRGEPIAGEWSLLCKIDIKYEPTLPTMDKNISCEDQAILELKLYMKDCFKKNKNNHHEFKICIDDGKTLAKLWGQRCEKEIPYNPIIPDEMPKNKGWENKCVEKAANWLKVYEKDCWFNHRGNYRETIDCLRKGVDYSEKLSKKCGKKIKYEPTLPEKHNFCINTGNNNIKEFLKKCFEAKNPKIDCKKEVLDIGKKWEKECNALLIIEKDDKLPPYLSVKNKDEKKGELKQDSIEMMIREKINDVFKKKKIDFKNQAHIREFLRNKMRNELKISILNSKKDVESTLNKLLEKKEIHDELLKSSISKDLNAENLNNEINKILNTNAEELLMPENKNYQEIKISKTESTDPEFIEEMTTFQKNERDLEEKKKIDIKNYNREILEYSNWSNESNNWVSRLKQAKSRSEYDLILKGYKQLIKEFHNKFKNCLPPPPPSPIEKLKTPVENSCHKGYKLGFKHGKSWAEMVSSDKGSFMSGKRKLKCLIDWLKEKKESLHHICAIRGAKAAYNKWWMLLHDKKKLQEYREEKKKRRESREKGVEYYKEMAKKIDQGVKGSNK